MSPSLAFGVSGTPLDDALRAGHTAVANYLNAKGAQRGQTTSVGAADPSADLCDAAARGDVPKLRLLIRQGLSVNRGDYDHRTAIHLASSEGQLEVIQVLVEELGADISPVDRWQNTPLDDALRSRHKVVAEYLRSKGGVRGTPIGGGGSVVSSGGAGLGGAALWVVPDAIAKGLRGELSASLPTMSDSVQSMVMAAIDSWDYDVIAIDEATGGHALLTLGQALLERHDLYEACSLDRHAVRKFLTILEAAYGSNAYHNAMHGADVAVGVHLFLTKFGLIGRLTKLELLSALVGAMVHDFNHPGTNNAHEGRLSTERALVHSDQSVLERHHLQSAFALLQHKPCDLFEPLSADEKASVRKNIIDLVLATDLSRHMEYLGTLRKMASTAGFAANSSRVDSFLASPIQWTSPLLDASVVDVRLLLSIAVKWADLGHSCKALAQHENWTERVTTEFWALGDRERALGVPVSPLCDREKDVDIPKSQVGFFKFIILPFYAVVADLVEPGMLPWQRVQANMKHWQAQISTRVESEGGNERSRRISTRSSLYSSSSNSRVDEKSAGALLKVQPGQRVIPDDGATPPLLTRNATR